MTGQHLVACLVTNEWPGTTAWDSLILIMVSTFCIQIFKPSFRLLSLLFCGCHVVNMMGCICTWLPTVYPKKYAHGFCFAVLCCGYTLTDFPISIRLTSLALWQSNDCPSASKATLMNMDKYFMWIHHERLHNHNKAKHNKTVCIFLGIYCTSLIDTLLQHHIIRDPINFAKIYITNVAMKCLMEEIDNEDWSWSFWVHLSTLCHSGSAMYLSMILLVIGLGISSVEELSAMSDHYLIQGRMVTADIYCRITFMMNYLHRIQE